QKALVVAEVALALVLLSGAGLMIRSFARLSLIDSGLDPTNVLTMRLSISHERYPKEEQRAAFYARVAARLRELPGVSSVAYTSTIPLSGGGIVGGVLIEHQPVPTSLYKTPIVRSEAVTIDYFRTLGIPLLKGREFRENDKKEAPSVVIVNDAFSRRFFPDEDPIGKRIKIGPFDDPWQSIVGVVRGVRGAALETEPEPEVYIPFVQRPDWDLALLLRTTVDPRMIAAAAHKEIQREDKEMPIFHVETMNQIVSNSISQRRFSVLLMSIFATVALLLAAAGIYGVMSYLVTQRTQEIGVRMALGAQRSDVIKLIISQGLILVFIGLVIGLITSLALTRVIKSFLFGISATDPLTLLVVSVLLVVVALISNLIAVLRATRIDPLVALRYE
ncbi:MAG: ABC transporter permease, partial [Blastocatellia bacterium]|nr:ABC transporter permease [Blastocatellia bacterium]